jgi:hypothetical protein
MGQITEQQEAQTHRYCGQRVIETGRRAVAGGVAVWVEKHPEALDWPWTVTAFSVAETQLEPDVAQAVSA